MKTKTILLAAVLFLIPYTLYLIPLSSAQANLPGAGNALRFNGTSDYVDCGNNASLNITGAITLEVWVKITSLAANTPVSKVNASGYGYGLGIDAAGIIYFVVSSDGSSWGTLIAIPSTITDNKWHHLAGVNSVSGGYLYLDGVLIGNDASPAASIAVVSSPLWIAKYNNTTGTNFFNGQIDEVRIWNRALNQTEIRDNMCQKLIGNETGLVGYWRFDETSGTTANDSQTNVPPNNGTLK